MAGRPWEIGTVTLPSGRVANAVRHPTTGEVFRDRGLYVPVPGTRPVGARTATTFRAAVPKSEQVAEVDDEACDCGANGGEGCWCCTDECPDDCMTDHRGEQ